MDIKKLKPITKETIKKELIDIGIAEGDTVFIKGDLGTIGHPKLIEGNIKKIFFSALGEVIGENGTIMSTAYTKSFLFWRIDKNYVFDRNTPSKGGAIANYLLDMEGSVRSTHPTNSYVAVGANARFLIEGHTEKSLAYTPLKKLMDVNAKNLFFGCIGSNPGFPMGHYMEEYFGLTKKNYLKGWSRVYYLDNNGEKKLFKRVDPGGCFGSHESYKDFDQSGFLKKGSIGKALALTITAKHEFEVWYKLMNHNFGMIHCDNRDCIFCNLLVPRKTHTLLRFFIYKGWVIAFKIIFNVCKGKSLKDIINRKIEYSLSDDPIFREELKKINDKYLSI